MSRILKKTTRVRGGSFAALTLGLALVLASCATDSGTPAAPDVTDTVPDASAVAGVPQSMLDAGVIKATTTCFAEPYSWCAEGTENPEGLFVELGELWAAELGLELESIGGAQNAMMPAVLSGRADVVLANGDTEDRRKEMDFVDILASTTALLVPAGNPAGVTSLDTLCGVRLALVTGTNQEVQANVQNDACIASDAPEIEMQLLQDGNAQKLALQSGRADAAWVGAPTAAAFIANSPGEFEVGYTHADGLKFGIGIPHGQDELREAIADALQRTIDSGAYLEVLQKFGLESAGIQTVTINDQARSDG